jgi:hypothetical protein
LLRRFARSALLGAVLIAVSLLVGMAGYHYFEALPWLDAFSNAAMILSGMGPLAQPLTPSGKVFAGLYALYSGLAVVLITGITFAPLIHAFFIACTWKRRRAIRTTSARKALGIDKNRLNCSSIRGAREEERALIGEVGNGHAAQRVVAPGPARTYAHPSSNAVASARRICR